MKKNTIAGVMLATAVALAFTGSVVSAEDAPGASTQALNSSASVETRAKGRAPARLRPLRTIAREKIRARVKATSSPPTPNRAKPWVVT